MLEKNFSYSFDAKIQILSEMYCSHQYLSIDQKKVFHEPPLTQKKVCHALFATPTLTPITYRLTQKFSTLALTPKTLKSVYQPITPKSVYRAAITLKSVYRLITLKSVYRPHNASICLPPITIN